MNARERFLGLMQYQPVDQLPVLQIEPLEKPAVAHWRSEGLPKDVSPEEFLGMDHVLFVGGVGIAPDPPFAQKVISDDAEYLVEISTMGATVRRSKVAPTTFYGHIDHPVKTRQDWLRYKKLLQPGTPGRVRTDLTPERIRQLNDSPVPIGLSFFPFFFRLGFYSMGMERFMTAFHDDPEMIHDMFDTASCLVLDKLKPILGRIRVDFAYMTEDLAFKNGTLVSPRTYVEFWSAHQRPILDELLKHHVPVIAHWSAGQLGPLIPALLDQGFNCIGPIERTAEMDALQIRKQYGRGLLLAGNIAKEALVAGPPTIDQELKRLMPLIREGGFLPTLDDMVPMECPFGHYRHLIQRLKSVRLY